MHVEAVRCKRCGEWRIKGEDCELCLDLRHIHNDDPTEDDDWYF